MPDFGRICAFIGTTHVDEARAFYRDTIGLRLVEDSPFALVFDDDGIMLRVQRVKELAPHAFTALGWNVTDIRAAMATLTARGVRFEQFGLPGQDETGVWSPPGSDAKVAWFKDPDGNTLSLAQH